MASRLEVILSVVDKSSKAFNKVEGRFAAFGAKVKKQFTAMNALLSGVVIMIGKRLVGAFISAASKMEVFANQLKIVTGNAKLADKALEAIREFARTSPLETEDVVQSFVRMRAVGIEPTIEQMRTIGGVAVLMNREMSEVLDSFIGLNKRTLRKMGVEIDRTGSMAIIKSGDIRKVVEKDSASIRGALLEVWEERFPNAIKTAADTTVAQTAIMRSEIFELSATIGEELLPQWNDILAIIIKAAGALKNFLKRSETVTKQKVDAINLGALINAQKRLAEINAQIEGLANSAMGLFDTTTGRVLKEEEITELFAKQARFAGLVKKIRGETIIAADGGDPLGGSGKLGAGGEDTAEEKVAKAAAKRAAIRAAKAEAERLRKEQEADAKRIAQNLETIRLMESTTDRARKAAFFAARDGANERVEITRSEWEERLAIARTMGKQWISEEEMRQIKANQIEKDAAKDKKDAIVDLAEATGHLLLSIGRTAVANSKKSAQEKRSILVGMAIAEGAGAAVSGFASAMDSGLPYPANLIAALATVVTVAGAMVPQISSIRNQSFARGTGFAPGGPSLIGEEGAEVRDLPRGTQVMTNTQTRQMIGGATISPTIIIQGNADSTTVGKIEDTFASFAEQLMGAKRYGYLDGVIS